MSIKIFVNYFRNMRLIENRILTPIQNGALSSPVRLQMQHDDQGDHISDKNPYYCELTGQYWVWKNCKNLDYAGFMHYRRFLDFRPDERRSDVSIHGIILPTFGDDFIDAYGLGEGTLSTFVEQYDMVLPEQFDVRHGGYKSVEDQYSRELYHRASDYQLTRRIFSELYPDQIKYFNRMSESSYFYPTNIFVFRWDIFEEYCSWLFPILDRIHAEIDYADYNVQERRVIGYLAERLFNVFVMMKRDKNPKLKIRELRRIFVEDTTPGPVAPPIPETELPLLSVVASSDSAYLPHLAALIASVFDNARRDRYIDFVVLDAGLGEGAHKLLRDLEKIHPNCSISYVDMSKEYLDIEMHYYFTRSTLFRLSMPDILENRGKVLFLDTDMICLSDVSELFETDLEGAPVGAVKDLIMRSFYAMGVPSNSETGGLPATLYAADYLGMGDSRSDYFQAGTLLLDLEQLRARGVGKQAMDELKRRRFWFLDQCVLNMQLVGNVKFLDHAWNTVHLDDRHLSHLTKSEADSYYKSHENPKIVHYAGLGKPWDTGTNPLSHYYWYYLRMTHWYESVLIPFVDRRAAHIPRPLAPASSSAEVIPKTRWPSFIRKPWKATRPLRRRIRTFTKGRN